MFVKELKYAKSIYVITAERVYPDQIRSATRVFVLEDSLASFVTTV